MTTAESTEEVPASLESADPPRTDGATAASEADPSGQPVEEVDCPICRTPTEWARFH